MTYTCAHALRLKAPRSYLSTTRPVPTSSGIFRAQGSALHTQRPRNVKLHYVHMRVHMPTAALLENPLVKRPDADPHRDFTLTSAATGMPASCIPQALLSIFLSRAFNFLRFPRISTFNQRERVHRQAATALR